jgi:polysaccharide biosynthesis protein PslG
LKRRRLLLAVLALVAAGTVVLVLNGGGSQRRRGPAVHNPPSPLVPTPSVPTAPLPPTPAPASAGPPASPAPTREQFGVNVNRLFNDRTFSEQAINAQLRALRKTGATIARSDTVWAAGEPNPPLAGVHRYEWAFDDEIARTLAGNGLRWLPIVDYSTAWASVDPARGDALPQAPVDYAAFAGAVAARYGKSGSFWREHPNVPRVPVDTYEIWNEPDVGAPGTSAAGYDELYASARDAIRSADPAARVVVGGLTAPATFLPAMLIARPDLRGHIDGVGIHPYGVSAGEVLARVAGTRATLNALGLAAVPLYVTEVGWPTKPPGSKNSLAPQRRPSVIAATLTDLGRVDCGVAATLLYTWVTPERNPHDREDWYGIHPPRGGSSSDASAFESGIRAALEPGHRIHLC